MFMGRQREGKGLLGLQWFILTRSSQHHYLILCNHKDCGKLISIYIYIYVFESFMDKIILPS